MKIIDLEHWKRKSHYEYFKDYSMPFFSVSANVDITKLYRYAKRKHLSFFATMLYFVMKAVNQIEELKYRIRENTVVLHDIVHPAYTVMSDDQLFLFVETLFEEDIISFESHVKEDIKKAENKEGLSDDLSRDDWIYISSLPWLNFTSVTHPYDQNRVDSYPRITWGKYLIEDEKVTIPLSLSIHHALGDGYHASQFFQFFKEQISKLD